MNSFKNRLKEIMSEKKMSQAELSRRTGIGRNSISDYLNGKYEAKQDKIFLLAKALNISEAWLMGFEVSKEVEDANDNDDIHNKICNKSSMLEMERQKRVLAFVEQHLTVQQEEKKGDNIIHFNNYSGQELQINGFLSAGTGETLFDDIAFKTTYKGYIPPHDIALQVNGDSMEPMFENKQIIFVEKTTQIKSGQIGVVIIDGEAYLKKVFINDDNIRLVSLNKKYKDMYFYQNHDVRLVGRVII